MIPLSLHFTLEEATLSQEAARRGIDNLSPPGKVIEVAQKTALQMEVVRGVLNSPIHINSWIRCLSLNRALGSKDSSQHILGSAVDFISPQFGSPFRICQYLLGFKPLIKWDQLILEHTWVHISWNFVLPEINRGEVLSLLSTGGYAAGLLTPDGYPFTA